MLPVSRLTLNVGHNRIQNYCGCIPRCPSMIDIVPLYIFISHPTWGLLFRGGVLPAIL